MAAVLARWACITVDLCSLPKRLSIALLSLFTQVGPPGLDQVLVHSWKCPTADMLLGGNVGERFSLP